MYSMTGFGKGEYREGGLEITVELRSVNNRFLDIAVKCPHVLAPYEDAVRSQIRNALSRGRIDVFIGILDKREKNKRLFVDLDTARAYVEAGRVLSGTFPELTNDLSLSFLMRMPDVLKPEEELGEDELLPKALESALDSALVNLKDMRLKEGERLKADVLSRIDTISVLREKIALRAPSVAEEYRKKLTERLNDYLSGRADENRILTEAAVFADKCNIDEELTRLSSHIVEFRKICTEQITGRKLDFLIQEFNRECNTICSKSNDAELTKSALAMKNEIEKIREQIQNLE